MGKKMLAAEKEIDGTKEYPVGEAVSLVKRLSFAKFDETLDMAVRLGVDPRKSDQMVRGTVVLPHGTGKKVRVLVFAKGEKEQEARDAGADFVGADDLVDKIKEGWMDFDKTVATPDMMGSVGKLGKILGPRGLMPNPKLGTVTFDLAKAVREIKAGKVEFKVEKAGIVHVPVGKISFAESSLVENIKATVESIVKAKPPTSKGKYLKKLSLSSTIGPGILLNIGSVTEKQ